MTLTVLSVLRNTIYESISCRPALKSICNTKYTVQISRCPRNVRVLAVVGAVAVRLSAMATDVDGSYRDRGNSPVQNVRSAVCKNPEQFYYNV